MRWPTAMAIVLPAALMGASCGASEGGRASAPEPVVELPPPPADAGADELPAPGRQAAPEGEPASQPFELERSEEMDLKIIRDGGHVYFSAKSRGDGGFAFSLSGTFSVSSDGGAVRLSGEGGTLHLHLGADGGMP